MRGGRSSFTSECAQRLRDGLGNVGGLASGLTMVDGRLADSLGRSEQGLSVGFLPPLAT